MIPSIQLGLGVDLTVYFENRSWKDGPQFWLFCQAGLVDDGNVSVDFVHMRRLVDYVYGQAASLVNTLNEKGIEHRDIDAFNFLIQPPSLRIVLMHFARAKIPHVDGMPDTEDPDQIASWCEDILSKGSMVVVLKKSENWQSIWRSDTRITKKKSQTNLKDVMWWAIPYWSFSWLQKPLMFFAVSWEVHIMIPHHRSRSSSWR